MHRQDSRHLERGKAIARAETTSSAPKERERRPEPDAYNARGAGTVAFAHFAHDLYPSFIGVLVPAVQAKLGISLAMASLMVPAQQLPSIFQPLFGLAADRAGRRWFVVLAPAAAALSFSMVGLAPHVAIVVLLLVISGLASAAFHAPAIALVGEYGGSKMGRAMAIFMTGGELARALGPLLMTAAIALLTLEGSAVVMVFGLLASVLLYLTLDTRAVETATADRERVSLRPILRARRRAIAALLGFAVISSAMLTPYYYFLVKFLMEKGHGEWYAGTALSVFSGAGVVGGLLGGSLSDRLGRRQLLTLSAVGTAPLLYLYLALENGSWLVLMVLVLAGMWGMSSRPVCLALAQELLPEARGPMAGILLAVQFVTLSLSALGFGALGDAIGVAPAFWWTSGASLLGLPFVALLPGRSDA